MNIIFICGSLEQGCDGVGDYVRCLAVELIKQKHTVAAIAINDPYVKQFQEEKQVFDNLELCVLRLPSVETMKSHTTHIKGWINQFQPDILSLQFVPFSFHNKGLLFTLSKYLNLIIEKGKWHIMFHELWVGMAKESPLKLKLWGSVQKRMVKQMLNEIKPVAIHSNTSLYVEQLKRLGYNSEQLPLFSNIASVTYPNANFDNSYIRHTVYLIVFGTLHPHAPIKKFAKEIANYGKEEGLKMVLRIVGRSGDEVGLWQETWKKAGLEIEFYGEKDNSCISKLLTTSSIGITTNPMALVEKSGTVAAMREHGLPVLSVSKIWRPRIKVDKVNIPGVLHYNLDNLRLCLEGRVTTSYDNVSNVSQKFIDSVL